ncbi:Uncharacterised protein [Legionella birminghamensis]|uniref:Uncharacterized protein n=1 Tax=Legionella birminghamensis TaxID=28083 RepID=A0A378IDU7_9GAMM|nr:Uncharacterised protein [Legionella birminghamensis]
MGREKEVMQKKQKNLQKVFDMRCEIRRIRITPSGRVD